MTEDITAAWPATQPSAPPVLLAYQQQWIEDRSEVKVCEKGRRIGLTWAQAADDVLLAGSESGMDVMYISYNYDMTREYVDTCKFWSKHFAKAATEILETSEFLFEETDPDGTKRHIKAFRIGFASGHEIIALSSRPKNLRGKQGRLIIDEAAFVEDLKDLLKAAFAFLIWGGQVIVISTHYGEDNDFNELVMDIRAGKKNYSLKRIDFNEALEDGLYRRICLIKGEQWTREGEDEWREKIVQSYGTDADEELFCIPSKGSGVYFPRIIIESCMDASIPILRWSCRPEFATDPDEIRSAACARWIAENLEQLVENLDQNSATSFGMDFGMTGDLSIFWPLQETANLIFRTPFLLELRNVPYKEQETLLFWLGNRLPSFRGGAMDARGNGQPLAQRAMQKFGAWRITQVMLTQEWYRDNMPRYKAAYEGKNIIIPKDADVLEDHRIIRMERGVAKPPDSVRTKGHDGGQRHGD